jgi:RNA ligase (TIGR02306 family)
MKLSGAISQGLVLPLSSFPELENTTEGMDVTELLGVTKYDVSMTSEKTPGMVIGNAAGAFPSFIPKTDQERIQNLTSYFSLKRDRLFEETLKLDGSSLTAYKIHKPLTWWQKIIKVFKDVPDYHFGVCSRNLELRRSEASDFWKAAVKYGIEQKLPKGFAVQGELIGPKIQRNHEKVQELEFYVFDIYDITLQTYLTPTERHSFMDRNLKGLKHVPIISSHTPIFLEVNGMAELLARVDGESMNPGTISEGRVYKDIEYPNTTFKVINNRYLLKCEG